MTSEIAIRDGSAANVWVVITTMCWPNADERVRAQASVAADILGMLDRFRLEMGNTPCDDLWIRKYVRYVKMRREFRTELFGPNGLCYVASAKPIDQYGSEADRVIEGGGTAAGLLLLLVARMHVHAATGCASSIARAITILERMAARQSGFGGARHIKDLWKAWAPVAPLWGGVLLAGGYPWGQTDLWLDKAQLKNGIADALFDDAKLSQALSYARWLRDFATSFAPPHATKKFLIDPEQAVRFEAPPITTSPPLSPLNASEIQAARQHVSH